MGRDEKPLDDETLFRQMMSGVKPLPDNKSGAGRITHQAGRPGPRPRPAAPNTPAATGFAPREHAPAVTPEQALFFARPGLQHRLLRQFKRGELRPGATLDLHGYTIAEAGVALADFLDDTRSAGLRCVCVIHGKGHRSTAGRPALKAQVNQWLRDAGYVLAFSSAQARDGGMGAVYVLLKRSR